MNSGGLSTSKSAPMLPSAWVGQSRLVELLREEILAVIGKHVAVERDKVQVKMEGGEGVSTLAIDIEIPALSSPKVAA